MTNPSEKINVLDVYEDSPVDLSLLPEIQNGSFLDRNFNCNEEITSPRPGNQAPALLLPTLPDTVEDEYSEFFFIVNPLNGRLEEAGPSNLNQDSEGSCNFEERVEVVPTKKAKRELSIYEETLLKEFSKEIEQEQKLLAEEHAMKMKLWELEMQTNQQEHALKMAILKEKLDQVKQEKEHLERDRNAKYFSKFSSGPI